MHPHEQRVQGVYMCKGTGAMPAPTPISSVALTVQNAHKLGEHSEGGHPRAHYKSSPHVIHPSASASHEQSLDGDKTRPLEIVTVGQYSRRQIDGELSYYVPGGTPCLVHDTEALGSTIGPKARCMGRKDRNGT